MKFSPPLPSSFLLLLPRSGSKGGMTLPCTFTLLPSTEQSGQEVRKVVVVVYIASSATLQTVYLLARMPAPRNYIYRGSSLMKFRSCSPRVSARSEGEGGLPSLFPRREELQPLKFFYVGR